MIASLRHAERPSIAKAGDAPRAFFWFAFTFITANGAGGAMV
ncbi:MAG TPA: hypothetical protein VK747_13385 [Blastocatellia bacterium]|nr:hypothetical protein [Blastocatellia bacterium]